MYATKKEERALLAARIIRKALQSGQSTLVQLMYKLNPEDYRTEDSINKLVKYLEESPLNRQPLPDAGTKIGAYYRRLLRRHHEPLPSPEGDDADAEGGQVNTDEADPERARGLPGEAPGSQKGCWKGAPPRGKDLWNA